MNSLIQFQERMTEVITPNFVENVIEIFYLQG